MENKKLPPKAVTALVFGILSIGPFAFLPLLAFIVQDILTSRGETSVYAVVPFIPSIVFSVISLSNARRGEDAVKQKPELYRGTRMLKAARVTAYIGAFLSFAALILIWLTVKK
jgi:hypothetical protein